MKTLILFSWMALMALPAVLPGFQARPAPSCCEVQKVTDNFYVFNGAGGNSGCLSRRTTASCRRYQAPGQGAALVENIKTITDKPITTVINTHCHGNHTGGNPDFPGITIVAQENTKTNMEKMDEFKKPENVKFLPNKTFKDKLKLFSGPDEIDLYYFGPGDTDGDAWVVFRSLKILATGDEFSGKYVALLDGSNGGSANFAASLRKAAASIKNVNTVVPGHAKTLFTMAYLNEFAGYNEDFLKWALSEKEMGRTPEQAEADYKYPAKSANYGPTVPGFVKRSTQTIYDTTGSK